MQGTHACQRLPRNEGHGCCSNEPIGKAILRAIHAACQRLPSVSGAFGKGPKAGCALRALGKLAPLAMPPRQEAMQGPRAVINPTPCCGLAHLEDDTKLSEGEM